MSAAVQAALIAAALGLWLLCAVLWRVRRRDLSAHVAYAMAEADRVELPCPRCAASVSMAPDAPPEPWRADIETDEVYLRFADIVWDERERGFDLTPQMHPNPTVIPGRPDA